MTTATLTDLKANLAKYLDLAKKGRDVVVTERGKPVARLTRECPAAPKWQEELRPFVEEGWIHLPSKPPGKTTFRPVKAKGKPLSEIVIEDRG